MQLSTAVRYGVRALSELAAAYPGGAVSLSQVAESQALSVKYIAKIMLALKSAGLVRAVRGTHGGYELTRAPANIRLSEVYEALEGPVCVVPCVDDPNSCERNQGCPTWQTWVEVSEAIREVLERTSLKDLAMRLEDKKKTPVARYDI